MLANVLDVDYPLFAMPEPLTTRQRQVFDAIQEFIHEHQVPPTVRQIGELVGLRSTASVQRVLDVLTVKGWITRQKGAYRTVNPVGFDEQEAREKMLPLAGNIAAGIPREAVEVLDTISVTFPGTRCLKVIGNVLGDHEILPGDRLHLEPYQSPEAPSRGHFLCRMDNTYTLVHGTKINDQPFDAVLGRLVAITRPLGQSSN